MRTISYVIIDLDAISIENKKNIEFSCWNIEINNWLLDVQLNEYGLTARNGNTTFNASILKSLCIIKKTIIRF